MANHTPLVEAWIRYAEDDWQDSQILASAGGNGRSICFHVQQCIEKLFKAELMRLKLPVPKTHNLRELSDLLHQADNRWIAETMTLNRLSLAAVDFRYPDPSEPEPEIDLAFILQIASELRSGGRPGGLPHQHRQGYRRCCTGAMREQRVGMTWT